jgi:hypothetical protein
MTSQLQQALPAYAPLPQGDLARHHPHSLSDMAVKSCLREGL